jgi:hypothetical protein
VETLFSVVFATLLMRQTPPLLAPLILLNPEQALALLLLL